MTGIDICSSGQGTALSDEAGKQSEGHKDGRRYRCPPEYLLLPLFCALNL